MSENKWGLVMQNTDNAKALLELQKKYEILNRELSGIDQINLIKGFLAGQKNQQGLLSLQLITLPKEMAKAKQERRDNYAEEIKAKIDLIKTELVLLSKLIESATRREADLHQTVMQPDGAPAPTSAPVPGQEHSTVSTAEAQHQTLNIDNTKVLQALEKKYESLDRELSALDNVDSVANFLSELDKSSRLIAEQNIENRAKLETAKAAGRRDAYTEELNSNIRSFTYEKDMLLSLIDSARRKEADLRQKALQAEAAAAPPPVSGQVQPTVSKTETPSLRPVNKRLDILGGARRKGSEPANLAGSQASGSLAKSGQFPKMPPPPPPTEPAAAPSSTNVATPPGSAPPSLESSTGHVATPPVSEPSSFASTRNAAVPPGSAPSTMGSTPAAFTPAAPKMMRAGSTPIMILGRKGPAPDAASSTVSGVQKPSSPLASTASPSLVVQPGEQQKPASPAASIVPPDVSLSKTATSTLPPNSLGETLTGKRLAAPFPVYSTVLGATTRSSSGGTSSPALSRPGTPVASSASMPKQEFYPQKVWEEDKILIEQLFAKAEKDGYASENAMEIAKYLSELSVKYFLMINSKDFYNAKNFGKPWSSDYPYTQLTSMLETIYDNIIDKASVKKEKKDFTKEDIAKKKTGEKTKKKFFEMCYLISEKFAQESNIALQIPFPGKIVPAIESRYSNVKEDLSDKIVAYFTNLGLEFTLPKLLLNILQATDHNEVVIPFIGSLKTVVVLQINEKQDRLDDLIAITDLIKAINLAKAASAGENRDEFKNILLKKILPNLFYPLSAQPSIIFTPKGFTVEIPGKETKEYSFEDFDKVLRNSLAVKLKAMYTKKDIDPSSIEISETVIKLVTSEGEVKEYAFEKWEKEMRLLENTIKENKKYVEAVFTPAQLRVAQQYKLDMYQLKLADNNLTQRATMGYIIQLREALISRPDDQQLAKILLDNENKMKSLQEEAIALKKNILMPVSSSEDLETKIFRKLRLKRALEDVIDIELGTAYPKKDKYEIIKERMQAHMVLSYEILFLEQVRLHEVGNTDLPAREEILQSQNRIIEELNTRLTKMKDAIELTPAYLAKDPPANTEKLTEKETEKVRAEEKVKENEKVKEREKLIIERRKDFITVAYEAIAFQQAKLHEIQSIDNSVREIIPQNQKKLLAEVSNQLTKLKDSIELTPA